MQNYHINESVRSCSGAAHSARSSQPQFKSEDKTPFALRASLVSVSKGGGVV